MDAGWQKGIAALLRSSRIAFLSTLGPHGPETSMAPFAIQQGDLLLHLSHLARHTKNLAADPRIGIMICQPEQPSASPLALPRLSLAADMQPVGASETGIARQHYLARIPEAAPLFSFADFHLYRAVIRQIHWVGGFGQAREVPRDAWLHLAGGLHA